jgi:excisionase family DNA binding protein
MGDFAKFAKGRREQTLPCSTAIVPDPKYRVLNQSLLTIEEVAELLHVPVSWVYERTRRRSLDRIPGFRLGKYWRFREADVVAWLERQRAGGRASA